MIERPGVEVELNQNEPRDSLEQHPAHFHPIVAFPQLRLRRQIFDDPVKARDDPSGIEWRVRDRQMDRASIRIKRLQFVMHRFALERTLMERLDPFTFGLRQPRSRMDEPLFFPVEQKRQFFI